MLTHAKTNNSKRLGCLLTLDLLGSNPKKVYSRGSVIGDLTPGLAGVADCGIPSLQCPWPLRMKHKQTNKVLTEFSILFIQEKSQRGCENSCGMSPASHNTQSLPWARPGLQVLGLQVPPFTVYGPPQDLIPCQSQQGCSGSQACRASAAQGPFDTFYLFLSSQTHRDSLPVTATKDWRLLFG